MLFHHSGKDAIATMRKNYTKPEVRAEALHIGAYGDYNNDDGGSGCGSLTWLSSVWSIFGTCCH